MKKETSIVMKTFYMCSLLGLFNACTPEDVEDSNEDPDTTTDVFTITTSGNVMTDILTQINLTVTASESQNYTYTWGLIEMPLGSTAQIQNSDQATAMFTPQEVGEYTVLVTVIDQSFNVQSAELTITAVQGDAPVIMKGDIDVNTTLTNRLEDPALIDYAFTGNVDISADLTIEPGVRIEVSENVFVTIGDTGSLNAVGTDLLGIEFFGLEDVRGYWNGFEFNSNTTKNKFHYVSISNGGGSGFDGANLKSNIMVENSGKLSIQNSTITKSDGYGVYTRHLESSLEGFSNNIITDNQMPIMTRFNHYHYFDTATDYTGNDVDYIDSYWSNDPLGQNVTWQSLNVPYHWANNVEIISSDLTIQAGVQITHPSNAGMSVSPSGSINATATADNPIVFKGDEDVDGFWKGIEIESNTTKNRFEYVTVTNGGEEGFDGANLKSNLMVQGSGRLALIHTTLTKSGGYGLYTRDLESALPDFEDNTITDNVAPVMTRFNHYHYFDTATDYTGNDDDYIDSYWSTSELSQDVTWEVLNVSYRLANNVSVINSGLTIAPGATFIGQPLSGLTVATGGYLNAVGNNETTQNIIFNGEEDVQGYWKGLRFLSNSNLNQLVYVTIENGGSSGFDGANRKANIEVGTTGRLNINEAIVRESGGNAIRVQEGGILTLSNILYEDNLSGNLINDNN